MHADSADIHDPEQEADVPVGAREHTAYEMIAHVIAENNMHTWALRGLTTLMVYLSSFMILAPLDAVAKSVHWLPLLGPITSCLADCAMCAVATTVTLVVSTVTIAIAWLFFRPTLSISMLCLAATMGYAMYATRGKVGQRVGGGSAPW